MLSRRRDLVVSGTDEYTCSGWACTDCLILLANGEVPADLSESEAAAWQEQISERNDGYNLTLGMLREEHSCRDSEGRTASDLGGECDCEVNSFSWSPCDVCAAHMGGERHAVSFWKILD
jgi:hypothetical protein